MKAFIIVYAVGVLPALVAAYGGADPGKLPCDVNCSSFAAAGAEFQKPLVNGSFSGCLFGQTSVEDSPNRCEIDCNGGVVQVECVCVSESEAEDGKKNDGKSRLISSIFLVIVGVLLGLNYVSNRQTYKHNLMTVYGGDKEKAPKNSSNFIWLVASVCFVSFGLILLRQALLIRNVDYWEGCGEEL